jgi:hypothetical protein
MEDKKYTKQNYQFLILCIRTNAHQKIVLVVIYEKSDYILFVAYELLKLQMEVGLYWVAFL